MTLLIGTICLPAALPINEKVMRENKFFENQILRLNNSTLFLNNYNDSSKVLIELDINGMLKMEKKYGKSLYQVILGIIL